MNAEDTAIAKEITSKRKRDERTNHLFEKKEIQSPKQTSDGKRNLPNQRLRFTKFSPLIMPIEQVLMQIKDEPSLQWPQHMLALVEGRDKSKYCRFHQDHRHRNDECRHMKKQIETLIH